MYRRHLFYLAGLTWLLFPAWVTGQAPAEKAAVPLVVERFPVGGATEGLEPEVLDFRYQPSRWQTCIGLEDDLYKTIVGSDGGLYYDYGKRGPEPYNNGQGVFGTRLLAEFLTDAKPGPLQQRLSSARVPIVISEQQVGSWQFRQEAWSSVTTATFRDSQDARVDYLWLRSINRGGTSQRGRVALHVGSRSRLELDPTRRRLLIDGQEDQVFCQFSQACEPPAAPIGETEKTSTARIRSDSMISPQRNWAHPKTECAECFQHVLVGFGEPLQFQVTAAPKEKVQIALGFIEGWHANPGKRPLRIEVEGAPAQLLDLVAEHGQNVPVVLTLTTADTNQDGTIDVRVSSVPEAEDGNTIISGLWVLPAGTNVEPGEVLSGKLDDRAIARLDIDHLPAMPRPIQLVWDTGDVAPTKAFSLLVAIPQGDDARRGVTPAEPAAEREKCADHWLTSGLPYDRITVPDDAVQDLLDSCIRNIYQARQWNDNRPKFQVGPTCYRGTWAADGPFLLEAVSYLGRLSEVRSGLEQQVDGDDGPGGVEFSKKSGLRLWMIWRHAQLTGDLSWLEKMWPRVEREVNQIIEYRRMTRDDPNQANYGLMPIGFGDGGLGGKHREYTNVYWTLAGLQAAIAMADAVKNPAGVAWQAEYHDYWQTFDRARNRDKLVDDDGNVYVPVTMRGEQQQSPQRGAWAFLQAIFPGKIFEPEDGLMLGTVAMLDANQREGLIYGTGWIPDGIWNYAGSFYGHAHLWLGHGPKAAATLYAFGNHASPLLCWREEQSPVGEPPHFVGDMPHNWASAEFIRLVRHLTILERGDELHLLEGIPHSWTRAGCELRMQEIPTTFGDISLTLKIAADGRSAQLTVQPPSRQAVARLVVHLESFRRDVEQVSVDGARIDPRKATIPGERVSTLMVVFKAESR